MLGKPVRPVRPVDGRSVGPLQRRGRGRHLKGFEQLMRTVPTGPGARQLSLLILLTIGLLVCTDSAAVGQNSTTPPEASTHFASRVAPFLKEHCTDCHSGDEPEAKLDLGRYQESARIQTDYELWERVQRMVSERQMPPSDVTQPTPEARRDFLQAVEFEFTQFDCSAASRPGRVTLRRLNRAEYNNTIRDLTGLTLNLADDFPSDDVGEGFDNIGDVLTISPILLEKYLAAAEQIAEQAYDDEKARRRILVRQAGEGDDKLEIARLNFQDFATRAFRRPVTEAEMGRLIQVMFRAWSNDASEADVFKAGITAILSSPHFLFRVERDPAADDDDGIRELDDYELASRLSYFLWSTMPDRELFDLAAAGKLRDRETLSRQTLRMLQDPKSDALVENFAGQWLQLRDVDVLAPDPDLFPSFDDSLRQAMRRETELLFATIVREDRSVLEFLNADYTFVNQRLAKHYGFPDVRGQEFQRVSLSGPRRGILTHASILMLTSNPTRTSPVKRGKWVLDNLLGEPPPDPPADVPPLEEDAETLGSLRERMEQHRANEACAVCHRKMDAIGFSLENFDAVGSWRDVDGRTQIDPSGQLPGGRQFAGPAELVQILAEEKKTAFCRCLTEKMLTYALGRGLQGYDRCTINGIVDRLTDNKYRFSQLVLGVVHSDAFTMREAEEE